MGNPASTLSFRRPIDAVAVLPGSPNFTEQLAILAKAGNLPHELLVNLNIPPPLAAAAVAAAAASLASLSPKTPPPPLLPSAGASASTGGQSRQERTVSPMPLCHPLTSEIL